MRLPSRNGGGGESSDPPMDFDAILTRIGSLGKFQWRQLILLFIISLCSGTAVVSYAFTGYLPDYRCAVPQCEEISSATYYNNSVTFDDDWTTEDLKFKDYVDGAIFDVEGFNRHKCQRVTFKDAQDSCLEFKAKLESEDEDVKATRIIETCGKDELIYDRKLMTSSFSMRFGFVCDRVSLSGFFNSFVMVGMLVGSLPVGLLADHVGRKPACALCIVLLSGAGVANAFVPWSALYALCRVIIGMAAIGTYYSAMLLCAEATLPKQINWLMKIYGVTFFVGNMLFGLLAFFIRNERDLQLWTFAPIIGLLIPLFFVDESARWLIAKGKYDRAKEVIKRMAKENGKVTTTDGDTFSRQNEDGNFSATEENPPKKANFCDIFRPKKMALRTVNLGFQWACVTATFYGFVFGATDIFGDKYANFTLSSFIGIPATLLSAYTFDRVGRRWSLVINQGVAGICCIGVGCSLAYQYTGLQVAFLYIGKFTSTVAFVGVIQYSAELYPTIVRNTAMGTFSSVGRLGGIWAIVLLGLKRLWPGLPLVLIGAPSILAAFLAIAFPESTGCKLPETIQQALDMGSNYKLMPWCKQETTRNPM